MSRDCYKSFLGRSGNVYILYNNKNTEENIYHAAVRATKKPNQIPSQVHSGTYLKAEILFNPTPTLRMQQTDSWLVSQNKTAGKHIYRNH